jgi:hypothetical protein
VEIPKTQNKMIDSNDVQNKDVQPTTIKAASQLENEYFYPESNGYQAITIRAATRQDAQAIYLVKRTPVSPEERSPELETDKQ